MDAIQSCGGQMTADGRPGGLYSMKTSGGILLNTMKTREPVAYIEIMKRRRGI